MSDNKKKNPETTEKQPFFEPLEGQETTLPPATKPEKKPRVKYTFGLSVGKSRKKLLKIAANHENNYHVLQQFSQVFSLFIVGPDHDTKDCMHPFHPEIWETDEQKEVKKNLRNTFVELLLIP